MRDGMREETLTMEEWRTRPTEGEVVLQGYLRKTATSYRMLG